LAGSYQGTMWIKSKVRQDRNDYRDPLPYNRTAMTNIYILAA
jgi:hypothetical protein